jgi:UDP-N-acetylmuramoyl-tripeptide--D-alanyl-D-alanine ligase
MRLTVSELRTITGGRLRLGSMPPRDGETTQVGPIVTDSRRVQPDTVFWGLKGTQFDGACFAEDALVRGASGVVVSGRTVEPWAGRWSLEVDNGLDALRNLASWHRNQFTGTMIGVTGSVGKTTTRLMIDCVLGSKFPGTTSPQNYNNHVGVPLSLLQLEPHHRYGVLELAASGPHEIGTLAALCQPQFGVITRIGEAHLGGFGTLQALAETKAELLDALPATGIAVLNGDDPWLHRMASRSSAPVRWVGRGSNCDVMAVNVHFHEGELRFRVDRQVYVVPVWGRHHLTSALAAIAVGLEFGMTHREIADALRGFEPPSMRCHVQQARQAMLIDDSYNASPTAMRAALELLREVDTPGERVIVCGDMAELGEASTQWHRQIGEEIVTRGGADRLIACGRHAEDIVFAARKAGMPAARTAACKELNETISFVRHAVKPGSAVLVKGARVLGLERVADAIRGQSMRRAA